MGLIKRSKEQVEKWLAKGLTADGQEKPDPVPLAPPVGYLREEPLADKIRRLVRSEQLRAYAEMSDKETFEEADDFDIPDDPIDPYTPYDVEFDPTPIPELRRRAAEAEAKAAKARADEEARVRGDVDDRRYPARRGSRDDLDDYGRRPVEEPVRRPAPRAPSGADREEISDR